LVRRIANSWAGKGFKRPVIDKDPPSDPMDKDPHLIDFVSYILLDSPQFTDPHAKRPEFSPIHRSLGY
jgi:hypothetical protein